MEDILNGQFIKTLPATFKKVQGNQHKVNHRHCRHHNGGPELNKRGKKRVINQELAGSSVKTTSSATSSN
jgi:hypothetical protein